MAFSLTSMKAYGLDINEPVRKRQCQVVEFKIAATAADVDLDIGDTAGTFWSAADDTAAGLAAKKAFADILSNAENLVSLTSYDLLKNFTPAGAAAIGAGLVKFNGTQLAPEILFNAGEGLTAYTITIVYSLKDERRAIRYGV